MESVLSVRIKTCREHMGINQTQLAKQLGISSSIVSDWEMEKKFPASSTVVKLAEFFNVSTDYLLGIDQYTKLNVDGLSSKEVTSLSDVVRCLKTQTKEE